MTNTLKKYAAIWLIGAVAYSLLEIAVRGYTHWTMTLTGGFVLLLLYRINFAMPRRNILVRAAVGSLTITAVEFTVGVIVNLSLGWGVWDYSDELYNLLGQICPKISLYWFALCIPVMILCDIYDRREFASRVNHEDAI